MFVVTKKIGRAENRLTDFRNEQEAIQFIMEKLQEDDRFKIRPFPAYGLYEGADLLKEYTQDDITAEAPPASDESSSAGGKGSGQSFRPTPFGTTPRIGPQSYVQDNKGDDKDEDKHS